MNKAFDDLHSALQALWDAIAGAFEKNWYGLFAAYLLIVAVAFALRFFGVI